MSSEAITDGVLHGLLWKLLVSHGIRLAWSTCCPPLMAGSSQLCLLSTPRDTLTQLPRQQGTLFLSHILTPWCNVFFFFFICTGTYCLPSPFFVFQLALCLVLFLNFKGSGLWGPNHLPLTTWGTLGTLGKVSSINLLIHNMKIMPTLQGPQTSISS